MVNPETLATLGYQDTGRRQRKQKTKNIKSYIAVQVNFYLIFNINK